MTVSSTSNRNQYTGNGSTTVFARTFLVNDADHLKVYTTTTAGVTTEVTSGITKGGIGTASGNVTFSVAPAAGITITLIREAPLTQETDYSAQGAVSPEQVEDDLDTQVLQIQDMSEKLDRSYQAPITGKSFTEGNLPAFDAAGNLIDSGQDVSSVASNVTAAAESASAASTSETNAAASASAAADSAASIPTVGTIATQDASSVTITGGSISGITDLAIADGGTGASTASAARSNMGLGTAAVANTGTGSGNVPVLNGSGNIAESAIPNAAFRSISSASTVVATDKRGAIYATAALTLSLTAAATLGAGFQVLVIADGGDVTIDPNASETVNGSATATVADGTWATLVCDGTGWQMSVPPAGYTDADAITAQAGLTVGQIGSYGLFTYNGALSALGSTRTGSSMWWASGYDTGPGATDIVTDFVSPPGTWRLLSGINASLSGGLALVLAVRIA